MRKSARCAAQTNKFVLSAMDMENMSASVKICATYNKLGKTANIAKEQG